MNLRKQLQFKRAARNLRTWGLPLSLGVVIGASVFIAADKVEAALTQSSGGAHHAATASSEPSPR